MFYCDKCAEEKQWPKTGFISYGCCEICCKKGACSDMPSKKLPLPKRSMKHTKEPWKIVGESGNEGEAHTIEAAERTIAWTANTFIEDSLYDLEEITEEDKANEERIVKCVNACEGLNPDGIAGIIDTCRRIAALNRESMAFGPRIQEALERALDAVRGDK